MQGRTFVIGERYLDDLFDSLFTQLYRHSNVKVADAVFPFKVSGTRENLLPIVEYHVDHFDNRRGWGIPGARVEQLYNFRTTVSCALRQTINRFLRHQFRNWYSGDSRITRQRNHGVSMSSKHERMNIIDCDIQLHCDERSKSRGVEHTRHSNHTLSWKLADTKCGLRHGIERITDHNDDALRRMLYNPLGHVPDDVVIGSQ